MGLKNVFERIFLKYTHASFLVLVSSLDGTDPFDVADLMILNL